MKKHEMTTVWRRQGDQIIDVEEETRKFDRDIRRYVCEGLNLNYPTLIPPGFIANYIKDAIKFSFKYVGLERFAEIETESTYLAWLNK